MGQAGSCHITETKGEGISSGMSAGPKADMIFGHGLVQEERTVHTVCLLRAAFVTFPRCFASKGGNDCGRALLVVQTIEVT